MTVINICLLSIVYDRIKCRYMYRKTLNNTHINVMCSQRRSHDIDWTKWNYAQFTLQGFGSNCYLFQTIAIYNYERQINGNVRCYDLRIKMLNIKSLPHSVFLEGQIHLYPSVSFYFRATYFNWNWTMLQNIQI